jgi:hypothetical protein
MVPSDSVSLSGAQPLFWLVGPVLSPDRVETFVKRGFRLTRLDGLIRLKCRSNDSVGHPYTGMIKSMLRMFLLKLLGEKYVTK